MLVLFESPVFQFLLALYGVAIIVGSWFVMHGERRRQWHQRMHSKLTATARWIGSGFNEAAQKTSRAPSRIVLSFRRLKAAVIRHRRPLSITAAILTLPMLILHLSRPYDSWDSYDDRPPTTDPVVLALLRGEQLVPPPELPPDVFLTREIEAERHEIATASREWRVLDSDFRQRLLTVFQLMEQHGYRMVLIEGYRSPQRQALLAKLGPHVTNAGAYQSYHQYGLAADSAFYRNDRLIISEQDPWAMEGYKLYGKYAESVGLVWGGNWRMKDFGHVELRRPGVMRN